MKEKKYFSIVLFILLCFFHLVYGLIPGWNKIISDFPNYYVSSRLMAAGEDAGILYNDTLFNDEVRDEGIMVQAQFSLYPPPTAFVLLPLTPLTPLAAKRTWLIINLVLVAVCVLITGKILPVSWHLAGNIVLLSGFCLSNDLMLGQMYLLMLAVTLGGYYLIKSGKPISGAFLWGIVMSLKYYTGVFIPGLFLHRKMKAIFYLLISFLLINFLCLLWVGMPVYSYFISYIFSTHLEGKIIGQTAFSIQFQSFESLFNRLFIKDEIQNPEPFYDSPSLFFLFKSICYALPLAFTVHLIIKTRDSDFFEEVYLSASLTLLLILEPGSATYHLLLLLFPIILACRVMMKNNMKTQAYYLIAGMGAIGFLSVGFNKLSLYYDWPLLLRYNRLWFLIMTMFIMYRGFYSVLAFKKERR